MEKILLKSDGCELSPVFEFEERSLFEETSGDTSKVENSKSSAMVKSHKLNRY